MIEIICGDKGKGKTKELLDKVNSSIKGNEGSIVFLDKSQKHMYELNNQVRLINVTASLQLHHLMMRGISPRQSKSLI